MKKAQVKFGENIGIIFITFLLIFFGLIWFNNHNQQEISDILSEDKKNKAFEQYNYITTLSLLKKSTNSIISEEFQKIALLAFANFTKTKEGKQFIQKELKTTTIQFFLFNSSKDFSDSKVDFTIVLFNNSPDLSSNYKFNYEELLITSLHPVIDENKKTQIGLLKMRIYIEES